MARSRAKLVVLGSVNVDFVAEVERLPRPGETIAAHRSLVCQGGKGANQAIAAARQRARVSFVGCVGDDEAGRDYRQALRREGIEVRSLGVVRRERTGTAMITVDRHGENEIVIVPGANARVTATVVRRHANLIQSGAAVLTQLETTTAAVLELGRLAARAGVPLVLNPSPWRADLEWGRVPIDTLILNEHEAAQFFHAEPTALSAHPETFRRRLAQRQVRQAVITRGAAPTLCLTAGDVFTVPTLPVRPVDTVGAGDAFAGTLAVALAEGQPLAAAVRLANCAGALATLALGAQAALPTRRATERAAARLR